jgi:hypothetical protein
MKEAIKRKLSRYPGLRRFAKAIYLGVGRVYSVLMRIPVLGRILAFVGAVLSAPVSFVLIRNRMRDIDQLAEQLSTVTNFMAGAEANFRVLTRTDNELRESLRKCESRLSEIEKSLSGAVAPAMPTAAKPTIKNPEKLELMGANVKVNLSAGDSLMDDYINVAARDAAGIDVVAEPGELPFAPESLEEIYSAHLFEYLPQETLGGVMLPYWRGLLKKNGRLVAVVPDWPAMVDKYLQSPEACPFEYLRDATFGKAGDFHFNAFTRESLKQALEAAGYSQVDFPVVGRASGHIIEMVVTAVKE